MKDITKQYNQCVDNFLKDEFYFIVPQLIGFGEYMVKEVFPEQARYGNLTGNTITSYGYGVYWQGILQQMGFSNYDPPIRNKLVKYETVTDFLDYDGRLRDWFTAKVQTDGGSGLRTSVEFLSNYKCATQCGVVFTTGTEYSEYLENVLKLNVLTKGFHTAKGSFLKHFKPMK